MLLRCPYCNKLVEYCADNRGRAVLVLCYTCDHCFRRASNSEEFEVCPIVSRGATDDSGQKCPMWSNSSCSSETADSASTVAVQPNLPFIT